MDAADRYAIVKANANTIRFALQFTIGSFLGIAIVTLVKACNG